MYFVGLGLLALGAASALVLTAISDSLLYFYSPSDLQEKPVAEGQRFRLGGLVEEDSVEKSGETTRFVVTDMLHTVAVTYTGILPDLFRPGQGVVTEGRLSGSGLFVADNVLAKHDETYMPPEVAQSLKDSGYWQEGAAGPPTGAPAAATEAGVGAYQ